MKKGLIIAVFALSLFGCDNSDHLEIGDCREYESGIQCTPEQLERNRAMIAHCTATGNNHSYCVSTYNDLGCMRHMFVVCRQSVGTFVSFNKQPEFIEPSQVPDYSEQPQPTQSPE